ncbi:hypothetical protein C8F04DRAFT_1176118 [Mycena alexandri]|uniref:Uncharacterized protein n=1 Tax=Mycena alexandri TaxID=1745969 RepID=A0AAD6T9U7_9AGAR|nr:hypothetical protein C8F04DRAFT_1176118 [Mycena alexandri]
MRTYGLLPPLPPRNPIVAPLPNRLPIPTRPVPTLPPLRVPEGRSSTPITPEAAVVNSPPQELAEFHRPLAMRLSQPPRNPAPIQARFPSRYLNTVPQSGQNPPALLGRLTEAPRFDSSSLLMRMGDSATKEEKSLLRRTGVQLHERISDSKKAPRHPFLGPMKKLISSLIRRKVQSPAEGETAPQPGHRQRDPLRKLISPPRLPTHNPSCSMRLCEKLTNVARVATSKSMISQSPTSPPVICYLPHGPKNVECKASKVISSCEHYRTKRLGKLDDGGPVWSNPMKDFLVASNVCVPLVISLVVQTGSGDNLRSLRHAAKGTTRAQIQNATNLPIYMSRAAAAPPMTRASDEPWNRRQVNLLEKCASNNFGAREVAKSTPRRGAQCIRAVSGWQYKISDVLEDRSSRFAYQRAGHRDVQGGYATTQAPLQYGELGLGLEDNKGLVVCIGVFDIHKSPRDGKSMMCSPIDMWGG